VNARALPAERPLRVGFTWTLIGNLTYAGCQWAMLMVLAKLTSPEVVGRFALGLAVTGPVFMFANLQLRAIQATDARGDFSFSDYLRLRGATTALGMLACVVFAVFGGFGPEAAWVVAAMALSRAAESLSDLAAGAFQREERMDLMARSLIARGVLGLLALAAGVRATHALLPGVLALAAAWAGVLLFHDLPAQQALARETGAAARAPGAPGRVVALLRLALPLGAVMLLVSLNVNLPRYVIERALGEKSLGLFAALSSALTAGQLVVNALGQSATPRLGRLAAADDRRPFLALLRRLLLLAAGLGLAGVAAAWLFGEPVVALLFTPEYARSTDVLVWILAAAGVGYLGSFLGYSMTALRAFKSQVPLLGVACALTLGLTLLWTPGHGLVGAAWALGASALWQVLGSGAIVLWALRRPRPSPAEESSRG
jgi:O-antigen/teichoic acid export membrane protein